MSEEPNEDEEPVEEEESFDYLVEEPKLFSESLIWELQRRYYGRHGIKAWSEGRIPFGISTSPHIAGAYARFAFACLRDWNSTLDLSEPVYIIELGAGSGRLGFNVLQALREFFDESVLAHIPFTYVLTDLVEENVAFWESHEGLRPFVEAGRLDFAQFDAINSTELRLRRSGKQITPGSLKNPIMVFANYIFDTLPQDIFSVEEGSLFAVTATLLSTQEEPDPLDPEIINRVEIEYDRYPVEGAAYEEPYLARILDFYRANLGTTLFLFPHLALRCIEGFRRLSGGRMALLTADKGEHRLEPLKGVEVPPIALHDDGFSMSINYNAVVQYFENLGSDILTTDFVHTSLNILAFLHGLPAVTESRQAYHEEFEVNSSDDNFIGLISAERNEKASIVEILAYIRMKGYDTHAFLIVYPTLSKLLRKIPADLVPELRRIVYRVWGRYYDMGESHNLPFFLGAILSATMAYAEAIPFYQAALRRQENHPTALFNLASSYFNIGERDLAVETLDRLPSDAADRPEVIELRAKLAAAER
ncbi:MAG: tetratricopeptide repeat protein [bacterium]